MLIVLHNDKVEQFTAKMPDMMAEYYDYIDKAELRKIDEKAAVMLKELRDKKDEKWDDLCNGIGAPKGNDDQVFEEKAKAALSEEPIGELKQK